MVCSPSTKARVDKLYLCKLKSNGTSRAQTRGLQTRLHETLTKLGGKRHSNSVPVYCTYVRIYTFCGLCHSELSCPPYLSPDSFIFCISHCSFDLHCRWFYSRGAFVLCHCFRVAFRVLSSGSCAPNFLNLFLVRLAFGFIS